MPTNPTPTEAVEIFCSYAHLDEDLRDKLDRQLSPLRRTGKIKSWHDRQIKAGEDWKGKIDAHLNSAHIILLLISPDFIHSDYCYEIEMARALERHRAGEARIISVIMRPCDWQRTQFADLQVLPARAKPVTLWANLDEALLSAAQGIGAVVDELLTKPAGASTPAATTSAALPIALPRPPVVGFVARRDTEGNDILARLKTEFAPGNERLIALWGPGGTGKTTLAAQVARELRPQFPQRFAWVSALARADFTLPTLLDEIATQLGRDVRPLRLEEKTPQVAALLAVAPALVVLDNFETVAPVEQVRCLDFLAAHAACSALITTRADTRHDDVRSIALAAMSPDEAQEFLRRLIGQTRKPENFAALDADALIAQCEANPLVLQWVVKQIDRAHQPQTVLAELAQGKGDAAERVFARSFNLPQVGDDGRAALLALTLFVPTATREALAEAAGFGDDLPRLERAVENLSALWLVETTAGNERLILRGLTRQLAQARLGQDAQADEYRRRFVAYFLRYAEAHAQETPEDYAALEVEKDNLLSAADTAFAQADWTSVMRLAYPMDNVLSVRGYWDETLRIGALALQAARSAQSETQVASLSHNLAVMYQQRGELGEARRLYAESLQIMQKLGDQRGIASSLHQLAMLAEAQGELGEARRLYAESLQINQKLGNQSGIAQTLHNLAAIAQAQGELGEARRLYAESLQIAQKLGDQRGIASTLHQLAMLAEAQGELEEARRLYDESLQIMQKLGNQRGIASSLHELGRLAQAQGELDEARRLYDESLQIKQKLGNQSGIASTTSQLGIVHYLLGEFAESKIKHEESLAIRRKLGEQQGIAIDLHELGRLAEAQGELEEARRLYDESLQIAQKLGDQRGIASTLHQLGLLAEMEGDSAEAARLLREALRIFERLQSPNAEVTRRSLARVEDKAK